jgi:hypothetical protein
MVFFAKENSELSTPGKIFSLSAEIYASAEFYHTSN